MNVTGARVRMVLEVPDATTGDGKKMQEFPVTEQSPGAYQGKIVLPADGEWPLLVEISDPAGRL